jgi:hypothetical protein
VRLDKVRADLFFWAPGRYIRRFLIHPSFLVVNSGSRDYKIYFTSFPIESNLKRRDC